MNNIKRVAVFCGASSGNNPVYIEVADYVGRLLAQQNIELVYGGGNVGLMGVVADAVMQSGGKVIGVIPDFLYDMEVGHDGITELIKVKSMHERKWKMHELSDAVITLPGGFGTMEEIFEMLTWAQLNLHSKPIGILNTNGFYDGLLQQADHMMQEGFLKPAYRKMLINSTSADELLKLMLESRMPLVNSTLSESQT
jgi:uncharacterized protein (TIGR00730 family)